MPAIILKTVAALSAAAIFANPPSPTARVTGSVKDKTGAAVRRAAVSVVNVETGVKRETESNRQGAYDIPLLPPGNYRMLVRKQGFKPISRGGILLNADQVARIDFVLNIGSAAETMNAKGSAGVLFLTTPAGRMLESAAVNVTAKLLTYRFSMTSTNNGNVH